MHTQYWMLAFLPLLASAAPQATVANPTVTIASGVVIGTATAVSNQPSATGRVNAYLGVPFAAPPTSSLRFASPTAAKAWTAPLHATTLPKACYQQFGAGNAGAQVKKYFNDLPGGPPGESEDCLYLNVFAPQDASSSSLKPVLFWLFGGDLQFGGASLRAYNGSSFAVNEDVVVVVPNYRTNFFGFSNSPQIPTNQQNSGLLDQRFALQWVQSNIAAFGGDPAKVTLFGESAGAYSIKQLLAQPPSPLPFRGAIMESSGLSVATNSSANYAAVVSHFGCSSASSQIACLRTKSATDLLTYVNSNNYEFSPVNDTTYVASHTDVQLNSGQFASVPLMIGTNLDEASIFLYLAGLPNGQSTISQVSNVTGTNVSSIYNFLLGNYSSTIDNDESALLTRIVTDLVFTCPTSIFSTAVALAGRQPVWRYRYDGYFPNLSFGIPNAGAFHSSEIPEVWGTYPLSNQFGSATANEIALSAYMRRAWANFAKDPSGGPGWPKLGSNFGVELGVLGGTNNTSGESTQPLASFDYPCPAYFPLLVAIGDAY